MATQLEQVTFSYVDAAGAPPGGDPNDAVFAAAPADTNLVSYFIRWSNGATPARTHEFQGTVALRAVPYSDVNAGATHEGDSGIGLASAGITPPPASATCIGT